MIVHARPEPALPASPARLAVCDMATASEVDKMIVDKMERMIIVWDKSTMSDRAKSLKVLGLDFAVFQRIPTPDDVKAAFRELAKAVHPDKTGNHAHSVRAMQIVQLAKNNLINSP